MDVALEVVKAVDDCCHRAVAKSAVVGTTVHLHRDPSTAEAQIRPTISLTVEWDTAISRLVVSADGISAVEHTMLDFMLMPIHKHQAKGHTGPPQHLLRQYGIRFEQKSQIRTQHGNRIRAERAHHDPTDRRYTPAPAPSVLLRPRAQIRKDRQGPSVVLRSRAQLKRKRSRNDRPRTQARNALEPTIPVIIPEMESSSDTSSDM